MSTPRRKAVFVDENPEVEEINSPLLNDEQPEPDLSPSFTDEDDNEDLEPDEELWPGGPKGADIDGWKKEFGEDSIYVTSLTPTSHVVWRTLTRFEYRRLVKNLEQAVSTGQVSQAEANMNNEEHIAEICILFPRLNRQQLSGEMAGLPSIISQEVMEASGFTAVEVRQL